MPKKSKGFSFDTDSPDARAWAKENAADLIDGINKTTRESIKELVDDALSGDFDVAELADHIEMLVGDEARADTIARTETMHAANAGQQEAWKQAADAGLLSGKEKQEWIVTPDDKLCPVCESLDGQQVGIDEQFESSDGDSFDGPPAHPNCRCTVGLVGA